MGRLTLDRLLMAASTLLLAALVGCGGESSAGPAGLAARNPQSQAGPAHGASVVLVPDPFEPDDTFATADPIFPNSSTQVQSRTIEPAADQDWVSFSATAGNTYYLWTTGPLDMIANLNDAADVFVQSADDEGAGLNFFMTFTPAASGTFYLEMRTSNLIDTGSYDFYFTRSTVAGGDNFEPDSTSGTAQGFVPSTAALVETHNFEPTGADEDWFSFSGSASNIYHLSSGGAFDDGIGAFVIPRVDVYDSGLNLLAGDQGSGANGVDFLLDFTPPSDGTYFVRVRDDGGNVEAGDSLTIPFQFNCSAQYDPAPTGVTATDGVPNNGSSAEVDISWTAGPGPAATSYDVYRSDDNSNTYNLIGTSSDTVQRDFANPRDNGLPAAYAIVEHSATGTSVQSASDGGYPALTMPGGGAATDGTLLDRVRLTWTSPTTGADYYQVFRGAAPVGSFTLLGSTTGTQYDDLRQTTSVFWYRVRAAKSGIGYGPYTVPDAGSAGLAAPVISATDGTLLDRVRVGWAAVGGAGYYQISRAPALAGPFITDGTSNTLLFEETQPTTTHYWYKVRTAIGGTGYSAWSDANEGYAGLAAPVNLACSDGTQPYVHITWDAVAGATHYQVFRATAQFGTYILDGTSNTLAFNDVPADAATYWYKVRAAVTGVGYSVLSSPDSGNRN